MRPSLRLGRLLCVGQGAYYASTGLWSLVSLDTFLRVTGPKTDTWLVQTVGALVLAIAFALLVSAWRGPPTVEVRALGAGCASAFACVDVVFWSQGRIAAIYLADAVAEAILLVGWMLVEVRLRRAVTGP